MDNPNQPPQRKDPEITREIIDGDYGWVRQGMQANRITPAKTSAGRTAAIIGVVTGGALCFACLLALGFVIFLQVLPRSTPTTVAAQPTLAPAAGVPSRTQVPAQTQVPARTQAENNLAPTATPRPAPTQAPAPAPGEVVIVRWFVGLGTGTDAAMVPVEQEVADRFNASHPNIRLELEVVPYDVAEDTLKVEIAAGNPPDIVGPVGTFGANTFSGIFLDLQPYVAQTGFDLSAYDPAAVAYYRGADGLTGLPFAVYPSFIFYNRDLFDQAALPYPPSTVGEKYDGKTWDWDTLAEVAMLLTLDASGNNAASSRFNSNSIDQFGYTEQWTGYSVRAEWSGFGAGNLVDKNGQAVISDEWRAAADWFYAGIWEKHFIPNYEYNVSGEFNYGNPFDSGKIAMAHTHLWYTCCATNVPNWDIAVMPTYNGVTTSRMHADTFRILTTTEHPDEAFTALAYLVTSKELLDLYGGMPASQEYQGDYFATMDGKFPQSVHWEVVTQMLSCVDRPSHEAYMPNFAEAVVFEQQFGEYLYNTPGLDLDAELENFLADLQAIFEKGD